MKYRTILHKMSTPGPAIFLPFQERLDSCNESKIHCVPTKSKIVRTAGHEGNSEGWGQNADSPGHQKPIADGEDHSASIEFTGAEVTAGVLVTAALYPPIGASRDSRFHRSSPSFEPSRRSAVLDVCNLAELLENYKSRRSLRLPRCLYER